MDATDLRYCEGREAEIIGEISVGIRCLYIEDLWQQGDILETLAENSGVPPKVLVTSDPPIHWLGPDGHSPEWLNRYLSFRKQLSSMRIYSPYPEKESELDDGVDSEDLVKLIRESGFDCTFLGQHGIDGMLGGGLGLREQGVLTVVA